jgi:hypothetical protein
LLFKQVAVRQAIVGDFLSYFRRAILKNEANFGNAECGVRSAECGVQSPMSKVQSAEGEKDRGWRIDD